MDKVVLITGAGSGMGKAISLYYAGLNAKLSIADIDSKNLEETAQNCTKIIGDNLLQTVVDVTKDEDVKTFVENTIRKFGKIDILMNCAGILRTVGLFDDNYMQTYDQVIAVNLRSIEFLTKLCAPYLIKSKGCIVNIASIAAILSVLNISAYSVSKAGVDHFTRCAALELAPHGVRVNAVLPGVVSSNLYLNAGMAASEQKNFDNAIEEVTPLKHVIETSEIVDLVAFLASDKARSITGSSYVIDSGTTLTGLNLNIKF